MSAQVVSEDLYDLASLFSGTVVEQPIQAAAALTSGNWASAGLDLVGSSVDAFGAVTDPIGTLASNGVAYAIDHFDPLKTWVEELTGDPGEVVRQARSVDARADRLEEEAALLRKDAADAVDGQHGLMVAAYRRTLLEDAALMDEAVRSARGVAKALQDASVLVEAVRSFVVGLISEVVGNVLKKSALVFTGVGAGLVGGASVADVHRATTRAQRAMHVLTACLRELQTLLRQLADEVGDITARALRRRQTYVPLHRGLPTETVAGRLVRSAEVGRATLNATVTTGLNTGDRSMRNSHDPVQAPA